MGGLQPGTTMYRIAELERIVGELRAEWIQAVHRIASLEDRCAALEARAACCCPDCGAAPFEPHSGRCSRARRRA